MTDQENPRIRGDLAAVLEIGAGPGQIPGHDPAYDLIRAVARGQDLRITRGGELVARLIATRNPEPRGDQLPELVRAIAALLAEANALHDRAAPRLGQRFDTAVRDLRRELGVSRTDPRPVIEGKLRVALSGQEGPKT